MMLGNFSNHATHSFTMPSALIALISFKAFYNTLLHQRASAIGEAECRSACRPRNWVLSAIHTCTVRPDMFRVVCSWLSFDVLCLIVSNIYSSLAVMKSLRWWIEKKNFINAGVHHRTDEARAEVDAKVVFFLSFSLWLRGEKRTRTAEEWSN